MAKQHYRESASQKEKKVFAPYLSEDEELVLVTGLGKVYLESKFIVGILLPWGIFLLVGMALAYFMHINIGYGLLLGMVLSTLMSLASTMFLHRRHRYLLTDRRVLIKKGIIAVKLTSALYDKITHIEVDQKLTDKLLYHHGKIIINTAGVNKEEIILEYIDYPVEFKNILERLINREREQFGLRSGPVVTLEGEVV